jgi:Flp pilus assembly protein TadD
MVGLLEAATGNRDAARDSYKRALDADAQAWTAANNLAWIYADEGKLDDAARLASAAEQGLPQVPEPKDTLGWIRL